MANSSVISLLSVTKQNIQISRVQQHYPLTFIPSIEHWNLNLILIFKLECRDKIGEEEAESESESENHHTYGDLGGKAFGPTGRYLTELLILVAQAGGSVAYLVFIGQNLSSVFSSPPSLFIFALLLPLEIVLSFIRSLSSLAPFSMFADVCNVLAMAIVIKEDLQFFDHSFSRNAFNGLWGLPFVGGVAVFCFEGFCMTLALEASMAERKKFRYVSISLFMINKPENTSIYS